MIISLSCFSIDSQSIGARGRLGALSLSLALLPASGFCESVYSLGPVAQNSAEYLHIAAEHKTIPYFEQAPDTDLSDFFPVSGAFPSYAEAWLFRETSTTLSGLRIIEWDAPIPQAVSAPDDSGQTAAWESFIREASRQTEISPQPLFSIPDPELLSELGENFTLESANPGNLLLFGINAQENSVAIDALERYLQLFPDDGDTRLNLSRRLMRIQAWDRAMEQIAFAEATPDSRLSQRASYLKGFLSLYRDGHETAFPVFLETASQDGVDTDIRLDALRRAAGCAHAFENYPEAFRIFDLLHRSSPDAKQKSEALLQIAGLAFETSGHDGKKWDEVRALCLAVVSSDGASIETQAIAELMYLETFHYERDFLGCIELGQAHYDKYKDISPREAAMALSFIAGSCIALGLYDIAASSLEKILEMDLEGIPHWKHIPDIKAHALNALIETARLSGNQGDEVRWQRRYESHMTQKKGQ